jgi:hypothetical protein
MCELMEEALSSPSCPATCQAAAMPNVPTTSSSGSSPAARKPIDLTVLSVEFAGQTIISNLWQGSGQPGYRLEGKLAPAAFMK